MAKVLAKSAEMPATTLIFTILAAAWLIGCSGNSTPTPQATSTLAATPSPQATTTPAAIEAAVGPLWRFVTGGWVSPREAPAGVFSQELRAFVIANQEQMDAYFGGFATRISRGSGASLSQVDFSKSILLAAYYIWRPLQGDPLSFVGLSVDGTRATVQLELNESPQGKEYPYLLAPMEVVAVERSLFPTGQPIEFVFQLNGQTVATVMAVLD